ncbi:PLP-dependent aminotransferase family protein [Burkholderia sp. 22PA0099]|uniref:aminotransferase-like domain-containing protein n=1 Tax=Burkholderia sp. 22PA0099 TaxID=3237372 RepID=UPI0039C4A54A
MNPPPLVAVGARRAGAGFVLDRAALAALPDASKPGLVEQIFAAVQRAIRARQLAEGARLPSLREVAANCGVSRDTAARAYDRLVAHGYLTTRRGAGFYVRAGAGNAAGTSGAEAPGSQRAPPAAAIRRGLPLPASIDWRQRLLDPQVPLASRLGAGELPAAWINTPAVADAFRGVARGNLDWVHDHGEPQGYLPLRAQIALRLDALGIGTTPARIATTVGATDALNLIVMAYLRTPGEPVLVDDPASYLLLDRLMASGLNAVPVPRDTDGPDPEALRDACERTGARMYICNTGLHNPTSGGLSTHRAFRVLQLAERYDLTVVEDDCYADLLPAIGPLPQTRLAALDQLRRVIYVGSFSKTLGAGLRVGYIAADAERIAWLSRYKSVSRASNGSLSERIVYRLLSEGAYRHHCEQLRARLDAARPLLRQALDALGIEVAHRAEQGMYLWGRLPGAAPDASQIATALLAQGHLCAPGAMFSHQREAAAFMRFNVASAGDVQAWRALAQALAGAA